MKIIHASDLHIRTGDLDRARYDEYRDIFSTFIQEVRAVVGEKRVILTGDIFHNKGRIEPAGIKLAHYLLDGLLECCDVFFICGNHDYRQDEPRIPDMLEAIYQNYFQKKVNTAHTAYYLNRSGVTEWPGLQIGVLDIRDVLKSYNTSGTVEERPPFPKAEMKHGTVNIALYHGMKVDTSYFDTYHLVLLGDNHKRAHLPRKGTVWGIGYAGSMIQQNYGESFFEHGYTIWDLDTKLHTFHELFNEYAFCTLTEKNGCLCLLDRGVERPVQDIRWPKHPRLQVLDGTDPKLLDALLGGAAGTLQYTLISQQQLDQVEDMQQPTIDHVNNIDRWVEFIKEQNIDVDTDYIYQPSTLALQFDPNDHLERYVKKLTDRNDKINKAIQEWLNHDQCKNVVREAVCLLHMRWDYLMCFGEGNTFDFTKLKNTIALLNGKNAIGKSSFLDVLCIALYGQPTKMRHLITGKKYTDKIIHDKKPKDGSANVKLTLAVGSVSYEIHRVFGTQSNKEHLLKSIHVRLYKDRVLYLEGATKVDGWIEEHVGPMESVLMSSMLCQMDLNNFFYLKHEDQKAILDRALSLESVSLYGKILKESILAHHDMINQLGPAIETLRLSMGNTPPMDNDQLEQLKTTLHTKEQLQKKYQSFITKRIVSKEPLPEDIDEQIRICKEQLPEDPSTIDQETYFRLKEKLQVLQEKYKQYSHVKDTKLSLEKCKQKYQASLDKKPTTDKSPDTIKHTMQEYQTWKKTTQEQADVEEPTPVEKPKYPDIQVPKGVVVPENGCFVPFPGDFDFTVDLDGLTEKSAAYQELIESYQETQQEYENLSKFAGEVKLEINHDCSACQCNHARYSDMDARVKEKKAILDKKEKKYQLWQTKKKTIDQLLATYPNQLYTAYHTHKQWQAYNKYQKQANTYKKAAAYKHEKQKYDQFLTKYQDFHDNYCQWEAEHETLQAIYDKKQLQTTIATLQEQYDTLHTTVQSYQTYTHLLNLKYSDKLNTLDQELKTLRHTFSQETTLKQQYDKNHQQLDLLTRYETTYKQKLDSLKTLEACFMGDSTAGGGFKEWIYRQHVIPSLNKSVNKFLATLDTFKFEMLYEKKNFIYLLHDRGNTPTLDKASGYQNFIIGLAFRMTLSTMGAMGQQFKNLFIDEGFTACDADNMTKVPDILRAMMTYGKYDSILVMSHLDSVRESCQMQLQIKREGPYSFIHV
jgi:DNA repair exonuclease SbcCD ATPase subunit/DNA repair exonuclease SbcCD nuclease subunit